MPKDGRSPQPTPTGRVDGGRTATARSFSLIFFARLEFPDVRARQASYSTRSALSGSTRAACRAGMTHASIAIAVSNSTTTAIVKGSVAVTP